MMITLEQRIAALDATICNLLKRYRMIDNSLILRVSENVELKSREVTKIWHDRYDVIVVLNVSKDGGALRTFSHSHDDFTVLAQFVVSRIEAAILKQQQIDAAESRSN